MHRYIGPVLAVLLLASAGSGQVTSFGLSAGYSHLDSNDSGRLSHNTDGFYTDADFAWRIAKSPVPVYAGVGVSGSGYFEDQDVPVSFGNGFTGFATLYSDASLFSVEARVAAPIGFQRGRGFFIMPRLGMGLVIDSYSIDTSFRSGGTLFLGTSYHDGAAFGIRPSVQAGYSWGGIAAGAEVSYMVAWGDFGELGNVARELRAGAFVRFQW